MLWEKLFYVTCYIDRKKWFVLSIDRDSDNDCLSVSGKGKTQMFILIWKICERTIPRK